MMNYIINDFAQGPRCRSGQTARHNPPEEPRHNNNDKLYSNSKSMKGLLPD